MEEWIKNLQTDFYSFYLYINEDLRGADGFRTGKWEEELCDFFQYELYYRFLKGERPIATSEEPVQHGKALLGETPVLTTDGFKRHADLKVGDYVFDDKGEPVKVLWNSGLYQWNMLEVCLDTGISLFASKEHLWKIYIDKWGKERQQRIVETQDIFKERQGNKPAIYLSPALKMPERNLPIDPYVLGLWLGDGSSSDGFITVGKEDIEEISRLLKDRIYSIKARKNAFSVRIKGLRTALIKNNLIKNKHIPLEYILSSERQRRELLYGLMDSDGCVDTRGNCEFCQKKGKLAEDVYILLRTLGIKARKKHYVSTLYGKKCGFKTRILFNPDKEEKIFALTRKQERLQNKKNKDRADKHKYFIREIKNKGAGLVNCIQVEGGIYLAGNSLIPTHNSTKLRIFTAWLIGLNGDLKFNFYTSSDDLREKTQAEILNILSSDRYRAVFGNVIKRSNSGSVWFNAGGQIDYRLMGEGNTGYPSNISIIDDPYRNAEDALSPTIRAKVENRFRGDIMSRRQNNTMVLVLHSRWHTQDLIGMLKSDSFFKDKIISSKHPAISSDGEALFPEFRDINFLKEQERALGNRNFQALYQQNPIIEGGNLIKTSDFMRFMTPPDKFDVMYIVADTAFSEKKSADNSAFVLFGIRGKERYLLEGYSKKVGFPALKRDLTDFYKQCCQKYCTLNNLSAIWVENKGSGISLIQQLREDGLPIKELSPTFYNKELQKEQVADKYVRFLEISADLESNYVYVPQEAHWLSDFFTQTEAFTGGKQDEHDDYVDCLIYGLKVARKSLTPDWDTAKRIFSR